MALTAELHTISVYIAKVFQRVCILGRRAERVKTVYQETVHTTVESLMEANSSQPPPSKYNMARDTSTEMAPSSSSVDTHEASFGSG